MMILESDLLNRELSCIPKELRFVLDCVNGYSSQIETLDWDLVFKYAVDHRFFPIIYIFLLKNKSIQAPDLIMKKLRETFLYNTYKITQIAGETTKIANQMKNSAIETIFLKGPPLSVRICEDAELRVSRDIDLLVDVNKLDLAEVVLEQMGYELFAPGFILTKSQKRFYLSNDHHFEYIHREMNIIVELHWRIRSYDVKHYSSMTNINTQTIDFFGTPIKVMADEHWLVYLMIHGYKHIWSRLRWLYDIKRMIEHNLDWNKILLIADKAEVKTVLNQTLILLNLLFKVPYPDALQLTIDNDRKAWLLAKRVLSELDMSIKMNTNLLGRMNNIGYYDFNDRWIDKANSLFSLLKPSEREFKQIVLPDSLFPLYYILRTINYVKEFKNKE